MNTRLPFTRILHVGCLTGMLHLSGAIVLAIDAPPTSAPAIRLMPIGDAWAGNSINTTIFRNDSVTTSGDRQYAAYYNADGHIVVATRTIGSEKWTPTVTSLTGNIKDAHNGISIIADGAGYLHMSWDHHGHPLRYVRSKSPGSLEFTDKIPMSGASESNVTYPQFFQMHDGNLIFLFRDGASGRGNLVINYYDATKQVWTQSHANLISGEGKRNAYWQACVDTKGSIHISWVWRDSPDVSSNHDMCYARSDDGGKTWKQSNGTAYALPITAATAEIVSRIPQKHELINQTSMCTDSDGHPIIATYFRPEGTTKVQYALIYSNGTDWKTIPTFERASTFSLSGTGSKKIPIARPQVFAASKDGKTSVSLLFRDEERGSKISVLHAADLSDPKWNITDLTDFTVRNWEPSYDHVRWARDGVLDLYVQLAGQGDGETLEKIDPQPAYVLEWKP